MSRALLLSLRGRRPVWVTDRARRARRGGGMAQAGSDSEDSTAERTGEGSRFLTAIPEERASEEEGDGPVREVADGGPLGTRPDPWEEGTRGIPHQSTRARSWCQCHI